MHDQVVDFCAQHANPGPGIGLELGGRDVNGNARGLWPNVEWTVVDITDGPGVDIVADARTWVPDREYHLVICTEVLEHVEDWQLIVNTAAKALAPGGYLVITCAGPGRPPHSGREATELQPDEHYRNVDPAELHDALTAVGLQVDICRQLGLDTQAVAVKPAERDLDGFPGHPALAGVERR